MDKNKIIATVIVAGLAIAFAWICIAIFFRGNSAKLVSRKLKIGALLLTLTAGVQTHSFAQKTCYKRAVVEDEISFDVRFEKGDEIKIDLDKGDTVKGSVLMSTDSAYVCVIKKNNGDTISTLDLIPADGKFNGSGSESFTMNLSFVKSGKYDLIIYRRRDNDVVGTFILNLKNEKFEKITCYYY